MSSSQPSSADGDRLLAAIKDRLEEFNKHVRTQVAVAGAGSTIAFALIAAATSLLLDRWLRLSTDARIVLGMAAFISLAAVTWKRVLGPFLRKRDLIDLAAIIDRDPVRDGHRTLIAQHVSSMLQLPTTLRGPHAASPAFVASAMRTHAEALENVDLTSFINQRRNRLNRIAIAAMAIAPVIWWAADRDTAALWFDRWFLASDQAWPQDTYLEVVGLSGGEMVVPRGERHMLRVAAREGSEVPDTVHIRIEKQGDRVNAAMRIYGENDFRYEVPPIVEPLRITIQGGDDYPEPFAMQPVDRPRIAGVELTGMRPGEDEANTISLEGADVEASYLADTDLRLLLTASTPVESVNFETSLDSDPMLNRVDETRFETRWTHKQALQFQVELTAKATGLASYRAAYVIGLTPDKPPRTTLRVSGVRQRVTQSATLPLTIAARDDFSLSNVLLNYNVSAPQGDGKAEPNKKDIELWSNRGDASTDEARHQEIRRRLTVSSTDAKVGSLLHVSARASDSCRQGAQTGKTRVRTFRIVEDELLFREILLRLQSDRATLRKILESAKEVRVKLDVVESAMEINALLRRHRVMQRNLARVTRRVDAAAVEMRLNKLGGDDVHELLQMSVITPLQEIHDDSMTRQRRNLESLAAAPDSAMRSEAAEAQDLIVAKLAEVLSQMSQWDSFVDVLNQVNEVLKLQKGVLKGTRKAILQDAEDLFDD